MNRSFLQKQRFRLASREREYASMLAGAGPEIPDRHLEHKAKIGLPAVRRSLDRIEAGTYGMCASCGEPIRTQRLESVPAAERCISCQSDREESS